MRIAILGASGLLGKDLMREWTGDETVGFSSRDADIRDPQQVSEVIRKSGPEWIVLSAAYTNVDDCESHPELAFAVNRDGAVNVAKAAKQIGAKLLFISSDYVFDGKRRRRTRRATPEIRRASTEDPRPKQKFNCWKRCRSAASPGPRGYSARVANAFPTRF